MSSNCSSRKQPVPVTVVTGFLGSGKSTLLNHILSSPSHGQKFAVIENELGKVSIDDQIIKKHVDEEIIEVTNGCICCSIRGDLVRALTNLYSKLEMHKFDGVLIETTGLADPGPIIQTFFQNEEVSSKYTLEGVVTVVDAKHILDRLAEQKPDGTINEAIEQIAFADRILLNKIDLLRDEGKEMTIEGIEDQIKSINATAKIIRTEHSKVDDPKRDVFEVGGFDVNRALELDPLFLTKQRKHRKDRQVTSLALQVEGEVLKVHIQGWLQSLISPDDSDEEHDHDQNHGKNDDGDESDPMEIDDSHTKDGTANEGGDEVAMVADEKKTSDEADHNNPHAMSLYRYKGVMAVKGYDNKFIFQGVSMVCNMTFSDEKWAPGETRSNKFVFIGKNLQKDLIKQGFENCLVADSGQLRFKVGEKVKAFCGQDEWRSGVVVGLWDEGNPYRIRLTYSDNGAGHDIWAPLDIDEVVRAY